MLFFLLEISSTLEIRWGDNTTDNVNKFNYGRFERIIEFYFPMYLLLFFTYSYYFDENPWENPNITDHAEFLR